MPQVTIYLDPETERRMRVALRGSGLSRSRWIARLIKERTADTWPESIARLAGAWGDLPTTAKVRRGLGKDVSREPL